MISDTEEQITRAVTRGITRRTVFQRGARFGLVVGGALAAPMALFTGKASASNCGTHGAVGTWGCYCAETARCGGNNCCNGNCCAPLRRRCTYWTIENSNGQMCWCSLTCTYAGMGGVRGLYHCCDCWTGGSGACNVANGASPCICAQFAQV